MNSDFEWRKNDLLDIITKLDDERILNIKYYILFCNRSDKSKLKFRREVKEK